MSLNNIILIGFMGCGKSSVGKKLSLELNYQFFDTDEMIEEAEERSINEIFANSGELQFRVLEEKTVSWLNTNVEDSVISTGGGLPVYATKLHNLGLIVYLKVPFKTIISRMGKKELAKRPLFKNLEKAETMYQLRDRIYEQKADLIIDADADLNVIVSKISSQAALIKY